MDTQEYHAFITNEWDNLRPFIYRCELSWSPRLSGDSGLQASADSTNSSLFYQDVITMYRYMERVDQNNPAYSRFLLHTLLKRCELELLLPDMDVVQQEDSSKGDLRLFVGDLLAMHKCIHDNSV